MSLRNALALALLAMPATGLAGGDAAVGATLYNGVCVACHGQKGEGLQPMNGPLIGGQEQWYLERQLKSFKGGLRGVHAQDIFGMQMAPMAATLADDAAVSNVAAYITSLKPPAPASTLSGDAAAGEALYAVCAECHGPNAEGLKDLNGPALRNQHDWYLERQIKNFKAGVRGADPKDTIGLEMKPQADTLTDDAAIKNVIAFITSKKQ